MASVNSQYLVETAWLEAHLGDPGLRILDCTAFVLSDDRGLRLESGRDTWSKGHIPGSVFADLTRELADQNSRIPLMMPPADQFAGAMSQYGIEDGTRVILYDAFVNMWAARVWWMLRVFGFDNAAVLNGGWRKWQMEERPISTGPVDYPTADFEARPRPELIADWREVLAAVTNNDYCIIDALTPPEYAGTKAFYGRAGHIPSSINIPAMALVDRQTRAYLPKQQLTTMFSDVLDRKNGRVIAYCGGGIASSSVAFILTLLGVENVAVYDGSLLEWASQPELPLEMGP